MKKPKTRRRSTRRQVSFRPDRNYIEQAVNDYLAAGGRINHVESTERTLAEFLANNTGGLDDVDAFLSGSQ